MPPTTILLMRHAEKPDPSRDIRRADIQGHESPAELSVVGRQRTAALSCLSSPAQALEMLPKPDVVFAPMREAQGRCGQYRSKRLD